jgi:hypothetical protein
MSKINTKKTYPVLLALIIALSSTSVFGLNMPLPSAEDIPAIAASGRASANRSKDPNMRLNSLIQLTSALIQDGDIADARSAAADARAIAPAPTNAMSANNYYGSSWNFGIKTRV